MIVLDSATILEVDLTTADAASYAVSYLDGAGASDPDFPGTAGLISASGSTTIAAAAGSGRKRIIGEIVVRNTDSVSGTFKFFLDQSGTNYQVFRTTLAAGETVQYAHGQWEVLDTYGAVKVATNTVAPQDTLRSDRFFAPANPTTQNVNITGRIASALGRADGAYSTITVGVRCTTAVGGTPTWIQAAVYKVVGQTLTEGTYLQVVGTADLSTVLNGTGLKTFTVTVSGIDAGDELWLGIGQSGGTTAQVRGYLNILNQLSCSGHFVMSTTAPSSLTTRENPGLSTSGNINQVWWSAT